MPLEFFTVAEVAAKLRCNPELIRTLIKSGKIKAIDLTKGKRANYRISEASLDAFIMESEVEYFEPTEASRPRYKPQVYIPKHM